MDIRQLLTDAASTGPLPDELPAAALWWRLAGTLSPATLDTTHSGLRPAWITDLHAVFGSALAESIAADPAWPGLVAAVGAADPHRWTPLDLLRVAAEHLRDADPEHRLRPDEYARLLTYSIDLFTTDTPFAHDTVIPDEPPITPEEEHELRRRVPDPQWPDLDVDLLDALGIVTEEPPLGSVDLLPPDPQDYAYNDELDRLNFDDLPRTRPAPLDLTPAVSDVHALRAEAQQSADRLAESERSAETFNGPAMHAAEEHILELRARAEADRPHALNLQGVIAEWADAEAQYDDYIEHIRFAEQELDRLHNDPTADPLDITSAHADLRFWREFQPSTSPAEQFSDALSEATAARAAAGGGDQIITGDDVDAAIRTALDAGHRALATARAEHNRLVAELHRAEDAAAAAFAHAESRSADHVIEQLPALRAELTMLEAAGTLDLGRRLLLPATATEHLPAVTASGLTRLAAAPFTVTPVRAADGPDTIEALQVLYRAAAASDRKVLWCSPTQERADEAAGEEVADTTITLAEAHRRFTGGHWRLPANSLVVVDHAADAEPDVLADLAGRADRSHARLILLDPDDHRGSPKPSAPLMHLLHADLPWSATLTTDEDSPQRRYPRPPDLDPVLDQAGRAPRNTLTTEVRDALARREALWSDHRSAYRVHIATARGASRDVDHRDDLGRDL